MKKRLCILCLLVLVWIMPLTTALGQDMNYTQYFSAPLYVNPAFTGLNTGLRARFLFRDQWPSAPIPFKSYYFSADLGDRGLPGAGGLGLQVESDNPGVGLINNLNVSLTIGVRIPITSFMVAQVGVKAGIMQRKINYDDLVFTSSLDPRYGNIYQNGFTDFNANKRVVPDFGAGGILQFSSTEGNITGNVGFAVDHIFKPDVSFLSVGSSQYPRKWVGHLDLVFATGPGGSSSAMYASASEPLKINVGALYMNQANLNSLQFGLNLLKYNLYLGCWYKSTLTGVVNSACAVLAGYKYNFYENMSIKFMYSYDIQISGALQGTGGAHEISLILEFDKLSIFGGGGGGGSLPGGGGGRKYGGAMECPSFY
ncbi:MAG: PorP/SprF family type IX secretion system membrane protein [Bacteroidales bacterium]